MIISNPSDYDTLANSAHKIKDDSEALREELMLIREAIFNANIIFDKADYTPYIKTHIALSQKLENTASTIEADLKAFEEYADALDNLERKYRGLEEEIALKAKVLFID